MATTAVVSQYALNIAIALQESISDGIYEDVNNQIFDLCGAVIALAECVNANASNLSTAVSPSNVAIGTQYSATQPNTYGLETTQR